MQSLDWKKKKLNSNLKKNHKTTEKYNKKLELTSSESAFGEYTRIRVLVATFTINPSIVIRFGANHNGINVTI